MCPRSLAGHLLRARNKSRSKQSLFWGHVGYSGGAQRMQEVPWGSSFQPQFSHLVLQKLCWHPRPGPATPAWSHWWQGGKEGAQPLLAAQAPHVNSLNKCSHFSQLIHPHVRKLKLCQALIAASSPTAHHSWRWKRSSPLSAFPLPSSPQTALPKFPGPPSSGRLALHKSKHNPGRALKETLERKGHYEVILSMENCISLRDWLQSLEPLNF